MTAETPGAGERARAALAGSRFADLRWVATTGSTNTDLLTLARDGAGEGVVLVADHQSAGRGRLGRTWQAPPGTSLLVSILLRPPAAIADAVMMATGVALVDAVAAVAGIEARLKWPNDVVVAVDRPVDRPDGGPEGGTDRKLAGILAEVDWPARANITAGWSPPPPSERVVMVIGAGVNVNWPAAVPEELTGLLTACNHLAGHDVDRADLLVAFLRGLDDRYTRLRDDPVADRRWLRDQWRERAATLGRRVRVDLGADDVEGTAIDIDEDGRLVIETLEGVRKAIAVGDVVHLRPPSQ